MNKHNIENQQAVMCETLAQRRWHCPKFCTSNLNLLLLLLFFNHFAKAILTKCECNNFTNAYMSTYMNSYVNEYTIL